MVLFTDENAVIDGGTAPFRNLPMCENEGMIMPDTEPGQVYGEIGDCAELCYANHIHPFDGACFKDVEYQSFIAMKNEANRLIENRFANDNTIRISTIWDVLVDIVTAMMISSIPFSAAFANVIIMILNSASGLGIKEIDVDGVATDIKEVVDAIRAKYQ